MNRSGRALIVAKDTELAMRLVSWLRESGCEAAVTTSYSAGREQLGVRPDIVLAELRLGAYNGLHLALRARAMGIPAVVFGDENPATEREARQLGATYLLNSAKAELQLLLRTVTQSPAVPSPA